MGFTMGIKLLLVIAMVATNLLSLYHLSTTVIPRPPAAGSAQPLVPDNLLHQLSAIRAAITHLTAIDPSAAHTAAAVAPSDLLLYSKLSPIGSSCKNYPNLLHNYMNYTPFALCPDDPTLADNLILRGCHPLPRRRCFSRTSAVIPTSLPADPFSPVPESLMGNLDMQVEKTKFLTYKTNLDLPLPQLFRLADSSGSVLRLVVDVGGGAATFAAQMKALRNVTVLTTTMNLGAPYNNIVAHRGLVPLHVPLQQRLPVFDGVVDLVRCSHAVNRWIPVTVMQFLFFDVDRVLRGGGYFFLDRFSSKMEDSDRVFGPLIGKLRYKVVKWAVANKTGSGQVKDREAYLTALLQKP